MSVDLRRRIFDELDSLALIDPHTHINPHAPASGTLADILGYVDERWRELNHELKRAGYEEAKADDDAAVVLIPRRDVETWVCSLLGDSVTEDEDCKGRRKLTKAEMNQAAKTAYDWARPNAVPGPTCVPSLAVALPQWRKIRAQR